MIAIGKYRAVVEASCINMTSTGKDQLCVTFRILPDNNHAGESIMAYLYFTDKALDKTRESLTTLGWDPAGNGWDVGQLHERSTLVGNEAMITVEHETYDGTTRARIAWINPPSGGFEMPNRLDDSGLSSLTNKLRQKDGISGDMPIAPKKEVAVDMDDVPF